MAKTVEEAVEQQSYSFQLDGESARKVFYVEGALSPFDAIDTVGIPDVNDLYTDADQPLVNFVTRVTKVSCENMSLTDDKHKIIVEYEFKRDRDTSRPVSPVVDTSEVYTFEPTGDSVRILEVPNENAQTIYSNSSSVDPGQYIGVNQDGSVDGVDILDNSEILTVTTWKNAASFTTTYQDNVRDIRNTVNSTTWYGAAPGEALFTGMRQVSVNETNIELEFTFLISRNRTSAQLPKFYSKAEPPAAAVQIDITSGKKGWQYLWTQSRGEQNGETTYTEIVGVVDVYDSDDFSATGLTGIR